MSGPTAKQSNYLDRLARELGHSSGQALAREINGTDQHGMPLDWSVAGVWRLIAAARAKVKVDKRTVRRLRKRAGRAKAAQNPRA